MNKEMIAKARELDQSVPSDWRAQGRSVYIGDPDHGWVVCDAEVAPSPAEAAFIAESRTLLPALADLAESEGRRADEAEAKLKRIINPPIKNLEVTDGGLSCSLDGPEMARIIATSFWDMLTENKADNYVEMTFAAPETPLKKVVVIVRKVFGRTPHDLRVKAEAERDAALAELAALKGQQP